MLKMNRLSILLSGLAIYLLASCSTRYAYSPSAHNVPVLEKKGDSKIGALYSSNLTGDNRLDGNLQTNRTRGFDLQGAYAITDNFAIQAGHYYRWEKSTGGDDTATITYHRNITELGVGYYTPISPNKKNIILQVFVGAGLGKSEFTDGRPSGANYFHKANVTKIYIQPAFLFRSKGSFTSAISLRGSIVNFSRISTNYSSDQLHHFELDSLNNRSKFFIEPAVTGSFGLKGLNGVKFEIQAGLSFLTSIRSPLDYHPFNFSIGTYIELGKLMRKAE